MLVRFFAIDLALHVALGKPWQGRKVSQGAVVYVAAEGGKRIKERLIACRNHFGLENTSIPFILARGAIDLLNENSVQALIKEVRKISEEFKIDVKLVIIDTLSRALSGGNENDSEVMGVLVKSMDCIRFEIGAAVAGVHHSGKQSNKGARGHSILNAAIDTEIEITDDNSGDVLTYAIGTAHPFENPDQVIKTHNEHELMGI